MRGAVRLVLCSALPPACRDRQWRPRRPNQHLPTHSFDKLPVSQENPLGRRWSEGPDERALSRPSPVRPMTYGRAISVEVGSRVERAPINHWPHVLSPGGERGRVAGFVEQSGGGGDGVERRARAAGLDVG